MPPNIDVTPGVGKTIAADDVEGALHQRIKPTLGGAGEGADALGGAGVVEPGVQRMTLASDDPAVTSLAAILAAVDPGTEYEPVAAGSTNQVLGGAGAVGDYLVGLLIIPASTSPGAVTIKDGAGAAITVFAGGAASLSNLVPFTVPINARSVVGAWQITTGANVSVLANGNFT